MMKILEHKTVLEKLSAPQLNSLWCFKNETLQADLKFADFQEAIQFMVEASKVADANNHHPNWSNVYNTITINLSTHSVGGITDLDFLLATEFSKIFQSGVFKNLNLF